MEKWFDALLLDLMDIVMMGCFGRYVMDWLPEDASGEWMDIDINLN